MIRVIFINIKHSDLVGVTMEKRFTAGDFKRVIQKEIPPSHSELTLQIEAVFAENGVAKGIWTIEEKLNNSIGVTMGGFLVRCGRYNDGLCNCISAKQEQIFVSIDLHTTFHRPVVPGTAEVQAKVERKGNRTAYLTAEIIQNGKLCCNSVSSVMIMEN